MSHFDSSSDPLDRILAEHRTKHVNETNTDALYARIRATLSAEQAATIVPANTAAESDRSGRSRNRLRWLSLAAAVSAIAVMLVAFVPSPEPLRAGPQALLEESRKVHQQPVDRCYLVELQRDGELGDSVNPFVSFTRSMRLWTRGDRFWIDTTGPRGKLAWGRDEEGTTWIAAGTNRGVRIDASEAPRWMTALGDVSELRLEQFLSALLRDFDLVRETTTDENRTVHVIRAEVKSGRRTPGGLKNALLELDQETKVLRKVSLTRFWMGRLNTTTYTLVETQTQTDDLYRMEGHLKEPFEILTATNQPLARARLLGAVFGPRALEAFGGLPPKKGLLP